MKLFGTVLWWDAIDQNGVIKALDGNKYYFDASVLRGKSKSSIASKDVVKFERNEAIGEALCAKSVSLATERELVAFDTQEDKLIA